MKLESLLVLVLVLVLVPIGLAADRAATTQASQTVPADLKPLLVGPASEMRLVPTRYNADRNTLSGNYAGQTGRGGGGRAGGRAGGGGAAAAAAPAAPARRRPVRCRCLPRASRDLKRFDLDWQAALAKLDTSKLSPAGGDRVSATLKPAIDTNLKQIEADALTMAQVMPALPFAPKLVGLVEARIRVEDDRTRRRPPKRRWRPSRTSRTCARRSSQRRDRAEAEQGHGHARGGRHRSQLRAAITEWFNFYNGYDPMFTLVDGHAVQAGRHGARRTTRRSCATKSRRPTRRCRRRRRPCRRCSPTPAPKYASVPDLAEIIALPQDETARHRRALQCRATRRARRPRRTRRTRRRCATRAGRRRRPPPPPDNPYYTALARGAEVARLRRALAQRAGRLPLHQVDAPRPKSRAQARSSRRGRRARPTRRTSRAGRAAATGLIADLQRQHDPVHARAADRAREQGIRVVREGDEEGVARSWASATTGRRRSRRKQTAVPPGEQPRMIMDLLDEAVAYLRANDLDHRPAVAAEIAAHDDDVAAGSS